MMAEAVTVWKVVQQRDGRLISALANSLPQELVCVYERRDGNCPWVSNSFCFATRDQAMRFARQRPGNLVWAAEVTDTISLDVCYQMWSKTQRVRVNRWSARLKSLLGAALRRLASRGARNGARARFQGNQTRVFFTPKGTLLARRLRLVPEN